MSEFKPDRSQKRYLSSNTKSKRHLAYLRRRLELQLSIFKEVIVDLKSISGVCEKYRITEHKLQLWVADVSKFLEEEFRDSVVFSGQYEGYMRHRVHVHQGEASRGVLNSGNEKTYIPENDRYNNDQWLYYLEDMRKESGAFAHLLTLFRMAEKAER